MTRYLFALALLPTVVVAQAPPTTSLLPSPPAERCSPAPRTVGTAAEWLARAESRVLPANTSGKVLRFRASHDVPQWEQSDRPYEPFIPSAQETFRWYDPETGVEARQSIARIPTPNQFPSQVISATASFLGRDTLLTASEQFHPFGAPSRRLNPWAVLSDWHRAPGDLRVVERCVYRDYNRIVIARGDERLYLTESDGVPIKLERIEPHYLFGQVRAEYLWNTWWAVRGGGLFPYSAARQFDGVTYERQGVTQGSVVLIPRDSAPRLAVPAVAAMSDLVAIDGPAPDTVRVNDHTFLLVTRAYTETVTLQRDTIYLLDATSGEQRGKQDAEWISKLFPGKHPVVLVVTDLAWPHISSLRYWVARGATVVSHRTGEDFIRRVVNRRWTLNPDSLERVRASAPLKFRAVSDSVRLGSGAVVVHALRGNSTEGGLAVWLTKDRYLWAGDFVQPSTASPYYVDVVLTARQLALDPLQLGAQHMPLTTWSTVEARVPTRTP